MSRNFTVSVLICAYNAQDTISKAIRSALDQTFQPCEILVIDDGSTDRTAAIVMEIAAEDLRVRLIGQKNHGIAYSRNRAVELASGEYLAFLDADDVWREEHLDRHIAMFQRQSDLGVAFSNARIATAEGLETGEVSRTAAGSISAVQALFGNPCTTCSTMLIKAKALKVIGPFDESLSHAEDQEWILRALLKSCRISCSGDATVVYRSSPSGLSASLDRMYQGFVQVRKAAARIAPEFVATYGAEAEARMYLYLARRAVRLGQGRQVAGRYLKMSFPAMGILLRRAPLQLFGAILATIVPGVARAAVRLRNVTASAIRERTI